MDRVADRVALMRNGSITLVENTEPLKERVREIRITFSDTVPDGFEVLGALTRESEEHECLVVVEHFDPALLTDLQQRFPDATIAVRQLDLEEIFVAYEARET